MLEGMKVGVTYPGKLMELSGVCFFFSFRCFFSSVSHRLKCLQTFASGQETTHAHTKITIINECPLTTTQSPARMDTDSVLVLGMDDNENKKLNRVTREQRNTKE
jgi:hypothetical protein